MIVYKRTVRGDDTTPPRELPEKNLPAWFGATVPRRHGFATAAEMITAMTVEAQTKGRSRDYETPLAVFWAESREDTTDAQQ